MQVNKKALGDFQTPIELSTKIINLVQHKFPDKHWNLIFEPSCGTGSFFRAISQCELNHDRIIGVEIQEKYVTISQTHRQILPHLEVFHDDILHCELESLLNLEMNPSTLVIGNPPWITNSELGGQNYNNLPKKTNLKNLSGMDALTGHSNFDITEYIILKLIRELGQTKATIALICKTSVARKVIQYCYDKHLSINQVSMYKIDASKWFSASVSACLFILNLNEKDANYDIQQFENLDTLQFSSTLTFKKNKLITNATNYHKVSKIEGASPFEWRQGIKHDASAVMELKQRNGQWVNKNEELVDIEGDYIYPLIKSSDVKKLYTNKPLRAVIIPQKYIGEDTSKLAVEAPKLWHYLHENSEKLDNRKSSIYKNRPRFSIFGVGKYSFAPYKIIISGFYKEPIFTLAQLQNGKPFMCDDTCYLLPFSDLPSAVIFISLLNHELINDFIKVIYFEEAKRPITKTILERINPLALLDMLQFDDIQEQIRLSCKKYHVEVPVPINQEQLVRILFPDRLL